MEMRARPPAAAPQPPSHAPAGSDTLPVPRISSVFSAQQHLSSGSPMPSPTVARIRRAAARPRTPLTDDLTETRPRNNSYYSIDFARNRAASTAATDINRPGSAASEHRSPAQSLSQRNPAPVINAPPSPSASMSRLPPFLTRPSRTNSVASSASRARGHGNAVAPEHPSPLQNGGGAPPPPPPPLPWSPDDESDVGDDTVLPRGEPSNLPNHQFRMLPVYNPKYTDLSRRERLNKYLLYSNFGAGLDVLQTIMSFIACALYVYSTYLSTQPHWLWVTEIGLSSFFFVDFSIRLYAAEVRMAYVTSTSGIVDILTVVPVFVDLATTDGSTDQQLFFLRVLRFGRSLRILRILRFLRLLSYTGSGPSRLQHQIIVLVFSVIVLIFCASGFFQVVEEEGPEPLEFHDAVYFTVVTITTLGYGDLSPKTTLGRMFVIALMGLAAILIPSQSHKILSILNDRDVVRPPIYRITTDRPHIIITGFIRVETILNFTAEFFHEDHGEQRTKLVLLSSESPSTELENLLRHPYMAKQATYVKLSPLVHHNLVRMRANLASAVFVMSDKFSTDPHAEDQATILKALALKNYCPEMRTYVQLLYPSYIHNLRAIGVDSILCIFEQKMRLLAHSSFCPGFTTLVSNLVHSASVDQFYFSAPWLREYAAGLDHELYPTFVPSEFVGMTFCQVAVKLYQQYQVIMFACKNYLRGVDQELLLNPSEYVMEGGELVFVIAPDAETVAEIAHFTPKRANEPTRSSVVSASGIVKSKSQHFYTVPSASPNPEQPSDHHIPDTVASSSAGRASALEERSLEDATVTSASSFEDHLVICGSVQNLFFYLCHLRDLPHPQPFRQVLLLNPQPPSAGEWAQICTFSEVFFMRGSSHVPEDLTRAGAYRACKVLYLTPARGMVPDNPEAYLTDFDAIFTVVQIDIERGIVSESGNDVHVIAEVADSSDIKFLRPRLDPSDENLVSRVAKSHLYAPSYMSGRVFTASMLETILSHAYYNPYIVALIDLMVTRTGRPDTDIHQIPVPAAYWRKPFGELFEFLAVERKLIPLALYRSSNAWDAPVPYVVTCPSSELVLDAQDRVFAVQPLDIEHTEAVEEQGEDGESSMGSL